MPYELKNANVIFISLVKAGANKREVVFKSADDAPSFTREFLVRKADDKRQMIYGIVYPVGHAKDTDTQGDFATAAEVEAMAYRFMRQGRSGSGVDRDHNYQTLDGVHVAESWIVRQGDPIFGANQDLGAWAAGIKIADAALYNELKAAGYQGFSMAGVAERVEVTETKTEKTDDGLRAWARNLFSKETKMDELKKAIEAMAARLEKLEKGETPPETTGDPPTTPSADMTKALAEMQAKVDALETSGGNAAKAAELTKQAEGLAKDNAAIRQLLDLQKQIDQLAATDPTAGQYLDLHKQASALAPTTTVRIDSADVVKAVAALTARLEKFEKAKPGSAQDDPVIEKDPKNKKLGLL